MKKLTPKQKYSVATAARITLIEHLRELEKTHLADTPQIVRLRARWLWI